MGIKEILAIKSLAISLISVYPRTTFEIKRKLTQKKYSEEDIEQAIKELTDKNYLNDKQYIKDWIKQRLISRPCGSIKCKAELLKKGIPLELIEIILPEIYLEEQELQIARKLAREKLSLLKSRNFSGRQMLKQKIAFFLENKGFTTSVIINVLNEII